MQTGLRRSSAARVGACWLSRHRRSVADKFRLLMRTAALLLSTKLGGVAQAKEMDLIAAPPPESARRRQTKSSEQRSSSESLKALSCQRPKRGREQKFCDGVNES